MADDRAPTNDDPPDSSAELDEPVETMSMKGSHGTAVGAAMLGFEQALRNEPPAETLAAEHMPERGQMGDANGTFTIEFPDPIERRPRDSS